MTPAWLWQTPFAHRGLHGPEDRVPENSRAAFQTAISEGFGIELDILAARDGVPMVFHDERLDRLCSIAGETGERTAAELAALTINNTPETIPSLAETLNVVRGRVPLLIEIKSQLRRPAGALELEVARILDAYAGPVAVQSFALFTVDWFRQNRPETLCGQIIDASRKWDMATRDAIASIIAGTRPAPAFIAHDVDALPSDFSRFAKARGVPVLTWTVQNETDAKRAREFADNVIFETWRPAQAAAQAHE
jgi:glycerophosphoryl diester phosphodiesterase